ncbi:anti-sigma factor domain-containing protein [Lutibacter sp. B2]|nr:anti-sigma factor domain-containing protein [Lutibacter sp. B2]
MIYRGCIVKIEKDFAIIMTDTMEYLKIIKRDGIAVGNKIIFVKEDVYKEKQNSFKHIGLIAAVFILLILSMTSISNQSYVSNAVAIVSLDINPSIEFEVDKRNKVINVIPINKEAKELMDRELVGYNIEKAIAIIIYNAKEKDYITETRNSIIIGVAITKDETHIDAKKIEMDIKNQLKEDPKLKDLNLIYAESSKKNLVEAKKEHVSIGKYEVYKKLKEKDNKITLKQMKEMKVQEIVDKDIIELKMKKQHSKKDKEKKVEKNKGKKEKKKHKEKASNKKSNKEKASNKKSNKERVKNL